MHLGDIVVIVTLITVLNHELVYSRQRMRNVDDGQYLKIYSLDDEKNKHLHLFAEFPERSHSQNLDLHERLGWRNQFSKRTRKNFKNEGDITNEKPKGPASGRRFISFGRETEGNNGSKIKVSDFQWKICDGHDNDPIHIYSFKILDDSFILPGHITISLDVESSVNLASPIEGEFQVHKKIGPKFVKIPCIADIGSCTYEDVCKMSHYTKPCPTTFQHDNIPCACPVSKGRYHTDGLKIHVSITEGGSSPSWLTDGVYKAKVTLRSGGKTLTCVEASARAEKM